MDACDDAVRWTIAATGACSCISLICSIWITVLLRRLKIEKDEYLSAADRLVEAGNALHGKRKLIESERNANG